MRWEDRWKSGVSVVDRWSEMKAPLDLVALVSINVATSGFGRGSGGGGNGRRRHAMAGLERDPVQKRKAQLKCYRGIWRMAEGEWRTTEADMSTAGMRRRRSAGKRRCRRHGPSKLLHQVTFDIINIFINTAICMSNAAGYISILPRRTRPWHARGGCRATSPKLHVAAQIDRW